MTLPDLTSAPGPAAADLYQCVHCGLCLPHCPTYLATGLETESPRGRIHLMTAVHEGRIAPNPDYARHLDLCLACRACEAACPSGVPFGRIIAAGRAQLVAARPGGPLVRLLRRLVFRDLLPHRRRLVAAAALLRLYHRSGLSSLAQLAGRLGLLPARLAAAAALLPALPDHPFAARGQRYPAQPPRRGRVALFAGCVMPLLYPHVHAATVRVLTRNGFEVVVPAAQTCCGALHLHAGERALARELAARVVAAFADQEVDAVIVNAAGCGAALKEYGELFTGGDGAAPAVGQFAGRVRDVTEFLAGVSLAPMPRAVRRRVALQESCHLVHAQRVKDAPRQLLRQVPGLELVELEQPDRCCGSAGIYNVVQPELSLQLLDERMAEVRASGADTIVTANPGCMLQLEAGLRRHHLSGAVKHVVEVLDEAYGRPEVGS